MRPRRAGSRCGPGRAAGSLNPLVQGADQLPGPLLGVEGSAADIEGSIREGATGDVSMAVVIRCALALGVAASLVACASDFSREVKTYSVSDDGLSLWVSVDFCGGATDLVMTLFESDDVVRIGAESPGVPKGGSETLCASRVEVALESPLGNRSVVDRSTNEELIQLP